MWKVQLPERAGGRKFRCVVYNVSETCSLICLRNEIYDLRGSKFQPSHHCGMKASSIFPALEELGSLPTDWSSHTKVPSISPSMLAPTRSSSCSWTMCSAQVAPYYILSYSPWSAQKDVALYQMSIKCSYIECSLAPYLMGMSHLPQEKWAGIWSEFSSDSWHPALCWACNGNSVPSVCCDD